MIRSRNLTSHTYNPALAHEIANLISGSYAEQLRSLAQVMTERSVRR